MGLRQIRVSVARSAAATGVEHLASATAASSSPASTTSATALTTSSSLRFITRTPVAERPCWEMPPARGPLHHAADADEHEFLVLAHDQRAREAALFLGQADRLDAFGAAVGLAVLSRSGCACRSRSR